MNAQNKTTEYPYNLADTNIAQSEKNDVGIMGWLDLLFSFIHPDHSYQEKLNKYGLDFNQNANPTTQSQQRWGIDTWTRLEQIKDAKQGRTLEQAADILFNNGVADVQLLNIDILKALNNPATKNQTINAINTINEYAMAENLDPNLMLNTVWNVQTDSIDVNFAQKTINEVAKINEITGNTALSILVQKSGGLSHEATENSPAFTGLLDKTLTRLQERENRNNPENPKTLSYSDINANAPAHLQTIFTILREDEHDMIVAQHMQNHDQFWSNDTRKQAVNLMQQAGIEPPKHEINLIEQWDKTYTNASAPIAAQDQENTSETATSPKQAHQPIAP